LHSIYVAHGSSRNLIKNNIFSKVSGDPVKFRNYCRENQVVGNTFSEVGKLAPIADNPQPEECPGYSNYVANNKFDGKLFNGMPFRRMVIVRDRSKVKCSLLGKPFIGPDSTLDIGAQPLMESKEERGQ